jgi:hypothetical protein
VPQIPTVRITHPGFPGGCVINESDFDPAEHEVWSEAPADEGGDPKAQDQEPPAAAEQEVAAPKRSTGRAGRRRGGK